MNIPQQYQIKDTVNQNTYLVGGELKSWTGATSEVYSTISSTEDYIIYMRNYYPSMIHRHLQEEISERLQLIRAGKIEFLKQSLASTTTSAVSPERVSTLGQLELNALEERQVVVLSKLELVENTGIVDTNVRFFIYNTI